MKRDIAVARQTVRDSAHLVRDFIHWLHERHMIIALDTDVNGGWQPLEAVQQTPTQIAEEYKACLRGEEG